MLVDDRKTNKSLGDAGAEKIVKENHSESELNVLTICNTGSLATAGYGTALGKFR
jgi:methylthioribose-1-phosphate isomerase